MAVATRGVLIADTVAKNMKGKVPPEKLAKLKSENVDYPGDFHLTPGNYLLRFVVREMCIRDRYSVRFKSSFSATC